MNQNPKQNLNQRQKQTAKKIQPQSLSRPSLPKIKDTVNTNNHGIIFISQKAIQDIYTKSGKLAKSNEFQVHYWFLNLRFIADDSSILDIAIPTCYFNYKQEVSAASIDFDLKDVGEVSEKVLPLHNMKANKLITTDFIPQLEHILGMKFTQSSQAYGSIHKHPGSSYKQSFSSTDLCKTASEPGVVYPFQSANLTPNFAGIMALDGNKCNVARYEYRLATGTLGTDIQYNQGGCTALMIDDIPTTLSTIQKKLGITPLDQSTVSNSKSPSLSYEKELIELFKTSGFVPSTDAISDTHLTSKVSTWNGWGSTNKTPFEHVDETKQLEEKYKDVTLYNEKAISNFNQKKLLKHIDELAKMYYEGNEGFHLEYMQQLEEANKADLIEEYMFLNECILDEYNSTLSNQESLSIVDEELQQMKEDLANFGVANSVLEVTDSKTIKKWHTNTTK